MAPTLTFTNSIHGVDPAALGANFFDGWRSPPSAAEHLTLLRGSSHVALALDGEHVVGFATAVSDGVLAAYIPLVEVLPPYRRQGVGSTLVRILLADVGELYMVDVMCDEDVLPFCEALGFRRAGGAIRRNRRWHPAE